MPEQQLNEPNECVEGVEALYSNAGHHLAGLGQRPVAQIHAHLGTEAEETCYQVIGLEDTLKMHLLQNDTPWHNCTMLMSQVWQFTDHEPALSAVNNQFYWSAHEHDRSLSS